MTISKNMTANIKKMGYPILSDSSYKIATAVMSQEAFLQ